MAEIVLKTNQPGEASELVKEMISIETSRVNHSLAVAKKRLLRSYLIMITLPTNPTI
jgi:hypothetical protein